MKRKYLSQSNTIDKQDLFYNQTDPAILFGEYNHIPLLSKVVPYLPLRNNYCMEGFCDMPITPVFNSDITTDVIPLDKVRSCHRYNTGVHGFVYDDVIARFVNNIYGALPTLRKHPYVIAPDFSSYSALFTMVNLQGIFLSRNVTCFLDEHGIPTVPCYTYSTFDSVEYSLLGLPMHSIIAVGHHVIGRYPIQREVTQYAINRLINVKQPTKLLVYGEPLDFDVPIEVIRIDSRIQNLRKIKR